MGTCLLIRLVEKSNKHCRDCIKFLKVECKNKKKQKKTKKDKGFSLLAMDKKKKQKRSWSKHP